MSEGPKTVTGLIAKEVSDVIPETDKRIAGRAFGDALVNVGEALQDVTSWVRVVAAVPRATVGFVGRVFRKWRAVPKGQRAPLPPKLLLGAASGYAGTADSHLRDCFERLVESAIDSRSASLVHPSFVSSLNQMSGLDARFMQLLKSGGIFQSNEEFRQRLGAPPDTSLIVTIDVLGRLGYVERIGPVGDVPDDAFGVKKFIFIRERPGSKEGRVFIATPVGRAFLQAVVR
jgi:hypothetical protein